MTLKALLAALALAAAPLTLAYAQQAGGGQSARVRSPEISADGRATFRIRAPNAQSVAVTALPGAGFAKPLPMTKDASGVWSVTTEALQPDIYDYQFNIDGAVVADPTNPAWSFGQNPGPISRLYVPGALWTDTNVPHGALTKHVYKSPIIGGDETVWVYTPPGYDPKRREPYPVLYALHGLSNDATKWFDQVGAHLILDNLIAQGKVKPMIMVSPLAYGNVGGNAAQGFPKFTQALIDEIVPMVEKQYNASSRREDRAVTGLSMGAAQSLLFLNHLDKFAWIGSFAPGNDMYDPKWGLPRGPNDPPSVINGQRPALPPGVLDALYPKLNASANSQIKLLYIANGTIDDHLILARQFRDFLTGRGVKITRYLEPEGVGHTQPMWRASFVDFAPLLFR